MLRRFTGGVAESLRGGVGIHLPSLCAGLSAPRSLSGEADCGHGERLAVDSRARRYRGSSGEARNGLIFWFVALVLILLAECARWTGRPVLLE